MLSEIRTFLPRLLLPMLVTVCVGSGAIAEEAWHVSQSSGEVWITSVGAQPAALTEEAVLEPGDTIRTSRNGRALLVRGAETILVSPNSIVGIPKEKAAEGKEGFSTIIQQAGTILLEVEKRNVQHFEVMTPYLAAVVKGTKFSVTVDNLGSHVEVVRGQVQVTDNKTGQYALVNHDQAAKVANEGTAGLSLSGAGDLSPVMQGAPVNPVVRPIAIPAEGFSGPTLKEGPLAPAMERRAEADTASPSGSPLRTDGVVLHSTYSEDEPSHGVGAGLIEWGKGLFGYGRNRREEGFTGQLAVPAVIGLSIAVGAGVMRRRQKRQKGK